MAQQFQLPDGRNLDYLVNGAQDGFPLVFIHGTPGSYHTEPVLVATCEKKGIKLISYSRAGYGGSCRNKGRRVVDSVADTRALLDHLGVDRFLVGGWSGGGKRAPCTQGQVTRTHLAKIGPHALASAARLNGCVAAVCIAGAAPFDAEGLDFLAGQGEDSKSRLCKDQAYPILFEKTISDTFCLILRC